MLRDGQECWSWIQWVYKFSGDRSIQEYAKHLRNVVKIGMTWSRGSQQWSLEMRKVMDFALACDYNSILLLYKKHDYNRKINRLPN